MRVAVYYNNKDFRLEERAKPEIGEGELLVKVEASGICGSDVLEWYRIHRAPLILGHEVAGTVVEAGGRAAEVRASETASSGASSAFKAGDRVVVAHHVPCNTCHYCISGHHTVCDTLRATNFDPGGFSEYLRVPAINVDRGTFLMPDSLSFDDGTFVEPLACVLRGQRVAGVTAGQTVLVLGSGISGMLHIALARAMGAGKIIATDIDPFRIEAAKRFGAVAAVSAASDVAAAVREANGGRLADVAIIATGAEAAVSQAFASVDRAASILFFAPTREEFTIPLPANQIFWRNEAKLVSSYAADPADHILAMKLIEAGRVPVSEMITHRLPLEHTVEGFKLVAEARESLKVVVYPHQ